VPDELGLATAEELAALPHEVLAERLAGAYRLIAQLTERVEAREQRPSGIPPHRRSRRRRTARSGRSRGTGRCGKRGSSRRASSPAIPARRCGWSPTRASGCSSLSAECRGCGEGLDGQPVAAQHRHQVTDIQPAPAAEGDRVRRAGRACPCCGTVAEGQLAGITVSAGWMAGIRRRAAALIGASGFADRVRDLLRSALARSTRTRPRPGQRAGAPCSPGLHRLPDAQAHRGPVSGRD
jgi:hypothetical protein